MVSIAIVADSTTSLPMEMYARHGITMVPYLLQIGGASYRDLIDITSADFNRYLLALSEDATLPTTATPSPGDYLQAFRCASEIGERVYSFHMTSLGSGAYQAATLARELAREQMPQLDITVVDTRNVSMCHGWIALQAARAAQDGVSPAELSQLIQQMLPATRMIQTADTLRFLYMGGRIGRATHLVGSALGIRPLISMDEGVIAPVGVARTREGALRKAVGLLRRGVGEKPVRLALTHAAAEMEARRLGQMAAEAVSVVEELVCELCPVLTVHTGPGTVGLCYLAEA